MSAQAITGTGEEPDLSNLSPSRKEDFLLFIETPPRVQPEQLTRSQVKALSEPARAARARRLRVWHANLGPFETPQLAELHEDMWDIIDSNAQDGDKVKGAIAVDAFPGLGKTTAVMAFARKYHLREIAEKGRFTPDGHERLPVCRVGLTGNTGMKDFNRAMLEFYGHPGRHRGTTAQMGHRALDCVQSCHCRLLIIDDLHFLQWGRTNGIEVSNHFKYIANEFPVTLLMVGVGLAAKGLYSEGDSDDSTPLAQTGRRTTPLDMQPFRIDIDQHRREWRQLLFAIEEVAQGGEVGGEIPGQPGGVDHPGSRETHPGVDVDPPRQARGFQPLENGLGIVVEGGKLSYGALTTNPDDVAAW